MTKNETKDRIKEAKIKKLINNLNKISIFLLIFNLAIIRFHILSPIELHIFFDKNKAIINTIYIILSIYAIVYFVYYIFNYLK